MNEAQRLKRGDIWTAAGGKDYAGKPRPVVIVQDDSFDATGSITVRAFTTDETDSPLFRLPVEPNGRNGLRAACRLMVDKISTVSKTKVGVRVGRLDDVDIVRLNQAVLVFLGLAVRRGQGGRFDPAATPGVPSRRTGPFRLSPIRAILPAGPGRAAISKKTVTSAAAGLSPSLNKTRHRMYSSLAERQGGYDLDPLSPYFP
jgi:mRNA interferase MazF